MILTTKGRYAVMSILELAIMRSNDSPISLAVISARLSIPVNYLEQIFLKLRKCGIVTSIRGPGGGYILARSPSDIFIDKIIDAVEEDIEMTKCGSIKASGCLPGNAKCKTHDLWNGLTNHIRNYFAGISIEDLVTNAENHATF